MYSTIDLPNWPRSATFEFFKNYDDPFFNITGPVDVTALHARCKATDASFFLRSLHAVVQAANDVEAFQLRLLNDQLIRYEVVHVGSTVLMPDNTFRFCYFDYQPDPVLFEQEGQQRIAALRNAQQLDPRDEALDLLHVSVIPWVAFTSFKHARRWGVADTVPKIVLGKYYEQGGRFLMPLSVEVHHAMMDGYHVGLYFDAMQKILDLA
ncbi:MAG: chloramphenicol acetyltransferase [Lewinellaceae bacterium]|nr:chloramphenicol acetyltransferase [Lewinellaceae bacterium]